MSKKIGVAVLGAVGALLLCGGVVVFVWMIDETQFERPDDGFDRLTAQVESLPGVDVEASERWVEAPTFSDPSSWISLTVDEVGLPAALDAACSTEYPDTVTWSVRVATTGGTAVTMHSDPEARYAAEGERCPDFGFDTAGLVGRVDSTVPGVDLQAGVWDNGRFALVALEEQPEDLPSLLPLVAHAEDLRDAAGLAPDRSVEVNSSSLILHVEPGEQERYLALLTELAEQHGVTSYWADGGGTPTDGVDKVQVVAPDDEHAAIEEALRTSGLHVAEFPVRFLPES